jgi:hypothetical protein
MNTSNKPQQNATTAPQARTLELRPEDDAVVSTPKDPYKDGVKLCLAVLLRAAIYGGVTRASENELKEALDSLG